MRLAMITHRSRSGATPKPAARWECDLMVSPVTTTGARRLNPAHAHPRLLSGTRGRFTAPRLCDTKRAMDIAPGATHEVSLRSTRDARVRDGQHGFLVFATPFVIVISKRGGGVISRPSRGRLPWARWWDEASAATPVGMAVRAKATLLETAAAACLSR